VLDSNRFAKVVRVVGYGAAFAKAIPSKFVKGKENSKISRFVKPFRNKQSHAKAICKHTHRETSLIVDRFVEDAGIMEYGPAVRQRSYKSNRLHFK